MSANSFGGNLHRQSGIPPSLTRAQAQLALSMEVASFMEEGLAQTSMPVCALSAMQTVGRSGRYFVLSRLEEQCILRAVSARTSSLIKCWIRLLPCTGGSKVVLTVRPRLRQLQKSRYLR